jgi:hypothetical protein
MKVALILFGFISLLNSGFAQYNNGFGLGNVTKEQLQLKIYDKDTSASAVVLDEFGEAYIDNKGANNLILEYKAKYKILKSSGLDEANFRIPLYKDGANKQLLLEVKATVYNLQNNEVVSTKFNPKDVFSTHVSEHWDEVTFALPGITVGSVFEVSYVLESPFIFNFYPWKFQSHLPKVRSEYWARIPGNYIYNIAFRGFVKLNLNESTIIKDCFTPGGPYKADCALYKYAIYSVPAFITEDHMKASINYLSSIDYELSEVKYFDGRVVRYTKTWKDVDNEFNTGEDFGKQIKKAKSIYDKSIPRLAAAAVEPRQRAELVYNYVKNNFTWNGRYGKYSTQEAKNAIESKKGNVGDINLSLVAALQAAGLNADPVILATRDYVLPHELFPVISDFNYVVACVDLGSEKLMLDATDPLLPFGLLPERCLNGKGRMISKQTEKSNWVELKPSQKRIKKIEMNLKWVEEGLTGTVNIISDGYEAYDTRRKIVSQDSESKYVEQLQKNQLGLSISDYKVQNLDVFSQPLVETMKIELPLEITNNRIYFNPFIFDRKLNNPFKASQRLYPVDFGAPEENTLLFTLELPDKIEVEENLSNAAFTLPANGGRFLLNATTLQNKISVTSVININKVVYNSNEYPALKELYNRIVESHNSQIVFSKK